VTQYLRHQHRECEHPISVLPPFSLLQPHKCPPSYQLADASQNIVKRLLMKQVNPIRGRGLFSRNEKRMDRRFLFSRIRHVCSLKEDDKSSFITCAAFSPTSDRVYCGTDYGDIVEYTHRAARLEVHAVGDGTVIDGIRLSKDGSLMLTWMDSVKMYSTDSFETPLFDFADSQQALFSNANDMIVGTGMRSTYIYDAGTGEQIANLVDPKLDHDWDFNIACFNPYDDLVLSDAVLYDFRMPHQIIHRFDRLTTQGVGIFHPSGNEVVINSEIWDVRTFKLLSTCPALSQTQHVAFSPTNDVIYAIYRPDKSLPLYSKDHTKDSIFRTIDARTYETIAAIDIEKSITDLAVDSRNNYVAFVVDEIPHVSAICSVYELGCTKGEGDEEEEEKEEDDDANEEEEEDDDDFGEFDDDDEFGDDVLEFALGADEDGEEFTLEDLLEGDDDDLI
jgi:HIV-1 Vpr-binding protein